MNTTQEQAGTTHKLKKGELLGVGCVIQVVGLICLPFLFPFGAIAGLILLVAGGRMAHKFLCEKCGNKTTKEAKICAACGARFDK